MQKSKASKRRRAGNILIIVGAVLLVAALALLVYNQWDSWRASRDVAEVQEKLEEAKEELNIIRDPFEEHDSTMATIEIDGWEYIGSIEMPRFGLELPVMSEWSYEGMRIAAARYTGSVWDKDLVICGHNYDRLMGNLRNAEEGDTVVFTDVQDNMFNYTVHEVEILTPSAVEDMITGDWDLTLFTCTIGGRTRVAVRCMLSDETETAD